MSEGAAPTLGPIRWCPDVCPTSSEGSGCTFWVDPLTTYLLSTEYVCAHHEARLQCEDITPLELYEEMRGSQQAKNLVLLILQQADCGFERAARWNESKAEFRIHSTDWRVIFAMQARIAAALSELGNPPDGIIDVAGSA
jgi:hypothetical protein